MKNLSLSKKLITALLLTAPLLGACQKVKQDRPEVDTALPGTSTPTPATGAGAGGGPGGTTDSGGGNGIANRVLEAYIVDPSKLPAMEFLRPIFDHLDKERSQNEKDSGSGMIYFFKFKTWYIAPLELKPIGNNVIGLHFANQGTEQLAIQTDKEVWINKSAWDKMSLQDQGALLLHEYVMNMYLLKFERMSTFCAKASEATGSVTCTGVTDQVDQMIPPEPTRPLAANDYASIRRVTSWLLDSGSQISDKEFKEKLFANGFDKRFFKPGQGGDYKGRKITVTPEMLKNALVRAKIVGRLPTECRLATSGETIPCEFDVNFINKQAWEQIPTTYDHLLLSIRTQNGDFKSEPVPLFGESNVTTWFDSANGEESVTLTAMNVVHHPVLGQQHTPVFFIMAPKFDQDGNLTTLDVKAIVVLKMIISEISSDGKKCRAELPKPKNQNEEAIIAVGPETNPASYLSFTMTGSFTPCY